MAIIQMHNAAGGGFDMSGLRNGQGSFSTYGMESPDYLGTYRYDYDTNYDLFQYRDGSGAGVFYNEGRSGVIVESIYYSDASFESTLSLHGIDVFVSYADLYAPGYLWDLDFLNGNDRIIGNGFNDLAKGGNGNDRIEGRSGDDSLFGEAGHDRLFGDAGTDRLYGGGGNDDLVGGRGADRLYGGSGADHFVFDKASDSTKGARDVIKGFDGAGSKGGDRIDVSDIDAVSGRSGNQRFDFGEGKGKGDLWAENHKGDTLIFGNIDNDRFAEIQIVIEDGQGISASDYVAGDFIL